MFNRMRIYTVHIKPSESDKPVFVREGFSIPAFLLTFLWALYHRLWVPAFLIIAINAVFMALGKMHVLSPESIGLMQFGVQILVGFHANDWLRNAYTKHGYITTDITTGDNLLRAQQRYFERYLESTAR